MPRVGKISKAERDEAITRLRLWLPVGSTVYCVIRHVSRSGMRRHISLLGFEYDATRDPVIMDRHYSYNAAKAMGWGYTEKGSAALIVCGCGMDMAFHSVYTLAQVLHGDGYALKSRII